MADWKNRIDCDATDKQYIADKVIPGIPDMEVHLEIFTLPSGKELHVWCDGRWNLIDNMNDN